MLRPINIEDITITPLMQAKKKVIYAINRLPASEAFVREVLQEAYMLLDSIESFQSLRTPTKKPRNSINSAKASIPR
jgi:hypothetical protein